jgi:sugar transferase (PEP-CTERM/EpsH1 system associated)
MKILFIVPYVPNLIRVRPYNLIRHLHGRGHQITLATLWSSEREQADLAALRPFCHEILAFPLPRWRSLFNCLAALPTRAPLQSAYCWNPALAAAVASRARRAPDGGFDVIHIEHLRGVRYGLALLKALGQASVPIVWDSVDSISYLFRQTVRHNPRRLLRALYQFELGRTEHFEGQMLGRFARILVTSHVDRQAFMQLGAANQGSDGLTVLPNGVDLSYFQPGPLPGRAASTVVVSGKMSYHPNIDMALRLVNEIMPLVWQEQPDVQVWIAGKDPPPGVAALANDARVTVTGTVPDLRPYLQKATLAVSPLFYGAGIQNKVLEAMACATPVIASNQSIAALQDIQPGEEILTAEDSTAFARQILMMLKDRQRQEKIGCAARQYVEKHHHWNQIANELEEIYQQTIFG